MRPPAPFAMAVDTRCLAGHNARVSIESTTDTTEVTERIFAIDPDDEEKLTPVLQSLLSGNMSHVLGRRDGKKYVVAGDDVQPVQEEK